MNRNGKNPISLSFNNALFSISRFNSLSSGGLSVSLRGASCDRMLNIDIPRKPTLAEYGLTEKQFKKEERLNVIHDTLHNGCFWYFLWCLICAIVFTLLPIKIGDDYGIIGGIVMKFFIGFIEGFCILAALAFLITGVVKIIEWVTPDPYSKEAQRKQDEKWKKRREKKRKQKTVVKRVKRSITHSRSAYNDYCQALTTYNKTIRDLSEEYPGLEACKWDCVCYSNQIMEKTLPDAIAYIKGSIQKSNDIANANWWKRLSAEQFELEIASWFSRQGYKAKTTKYVGDGGVDVILERNGEKTYVQCKHFVGGKVDIKVVRELCGVMSSDGVTKGVIACLNGLSSDNAYSFAHKNNIRVVDLATLTGGAERVTINEEDLPGYYRINDFKILKDVFLTPDDAFEQASKNLTIGVSIMRIRRYYMLVESTDGAVLNSHVVVKKRQGSQKNTERPDTLSIREDGQMTLF